MHIVQIFLILKNTIFNSRCNKSCYVTKLCIPLHVLCATHSRVALSDIEFIYM